MPGLLQDAYEVYTENTKLVLLFSIPFAIAFAIPLVAHLFTYVTLGGTFLSTAGTFNGIDVPSMVIIVVSTIFSLLFLSFAFVAISMIVKSRKTHVSIGKRALMEIEKHIGKVFAVLLLYSFILLAINLLSYAFAPGLAAGITALFGFIIGAITFYAPSAIVIDNKRVLRSIGDSVRLVVHTPQYYLLWITLLTLVISLLDVIAIAVFGTVLSGYVTLILISIFVLPYFVILQTEAYMRKFPLLVH